MAGDSLEASPQALSMAEVQSSHENSTSPGAASSPRMTKAKPKKRSTVTPRTFTRFFTPRPIVKGKRIGASRRVLKDITASANGNKSLYKDDQLKIGDKSDGFPDIITAKKRKAASGPPIASDEFLAAKRSRKQSVGRSEESETDDCPTEPLGPYSGPAITENLQSNGCDRAANAITRSCYRGSLGRVMVRELDGSRGKASSSHSSDWQSQTANFFSRPKDTHACTNLVTAMPKQTLPFCAASCNTNSLVAIGDEEGGVRLLESAKDSKPDFSKAYLVFRPHANAILDLAFSSDDLLLATASGDQTAQVIDMPTQRATFALTGHVSSVKQVRFQPGSCNNVLATSSRDGTVHIWDLRCKGFDAPMKELQVSMGNIEETPTAASTTNQNMTWARFVDSIHEAHASPLTSFPKSTTMDKEVLSPCEWPGRRGNVSITALSFLHPGRENLLITASEANASVKLWDLRKTHNLRRNRAMPVSTTRQPESHDKHRQFGLTSIALSGDGSRLYTLCRDSTVYAYSTSHLVTGHASESSPVPSRPRRPGDTEKGGPSPLYGFRHSKFHASTFYVKLSLRSPKDDKNELLAVGSSDGCAVVFPTDELYMQRSRSSIHRVGTQSASTEAPSPSPMSRPGLGRSNSGSCFSNRLVDTIPIYQHGSALVRGHEREVTGSTWTSHGELITVGDDITARCWREGPEARSLRTGGELEGKRWRCGWAEVEGDFDDDD